jgi:glycosyltransferase involved in cell wall biosynthesis
MAADGDDGAAPAVSIVLPIYRNLGTLPALLDRLETALAPAVTGWEAICVEDAGGDGARDWLARRAHADGRVRLLANPRNLGQHRSVLVGLAAARGARVVVMDADLQDVPEDVPRLLAAWRPGVGAVFARRPAPYQALGRHRSGRLLKRLVRLVAGAAAPPAGTGMFFVVGAEARATALAARVDRPYVPQLVARCRLPLETVDLAKSPRGDGASGYRFGSRLRLALDALLQAVAWRLGRR